MLLVQNWGQLRPEQGSRVTYAVKWMQRSKGEETDSKRQKQRSRINEWSKEVEGKKQKG